MTAWTVALLASPAAGAAAAWVSARLAGSAKPGVRLTVLMVLGMFAAAGCAYGRAPGEGVASLALGWTLLVLASVDLATFRLPDLLTWPLAVAGLVRAWLVEAEFGAHLAGLVVGYGAIAGVGWAFERLRGRRGIGLGDAKLFAAAGAWLGWTALPSVMLVACALGFTGFALAVLWRGRGALSQALPFGPALCGAFWLVWLMR